MNLFGLGPTELLIIAAIILLLFGPKRLPQIGKALGQTAKSVRDGLEGKIEDEAPAEKTEPVAAEPTKIEAAQAEPVEVAPVAAEPVAATVTESAEPPYEIADTTNHDKAV